MIFSKSVCQVFLSAAVVLSLSGCGGGGDDGDADAGGTDNASNQPVLTGSNGYAGGNVVFVGQRIVGEWSATKLTSRTAGDSFKSSETYLTLGIKFDDVRYQEYWVRYYIASNGRLASEAAWTPVGSYGVSRDGQTLVIERGATRKSYTHKSTYTYNGKPCITVTEAGTSEDYDLCKVS